MADKRTQDEAAWFTSPNTEQQNHRRYEALRSYFVDHLTLAEAATKHGYPYWTFVNLVRDHRANKLTLFTPRKPPGPPKGIAPAKDRARGRVIELRREGLSVYEISAHLAAQGMALNRTSVGEILQEEGFGRLIRHPHPEASTSPPTPGRDTQLPKTAPLKINELSPTMTTRHAGLLLLLPDLLALNLPGAVQAAGYPASGPLSPLNWILSLLALKLTGVRRLSHVDDLLLADPAASLFTGLAHLPKKTALTDYSYRTCHNNQTALLANLAIAMDREHLTNPAGVFNLDFHTIMHWGHDPVLEKHYVPTRSQRARSTLAFLAEDHHTGNLVYANTDLTKATQAYEPIAFCDHWKQATGHDPNTLVMDQKVTTGHHLGLLNERGIKFITLRARSQPLIRHINTLTPTDYQTTTLNRPGPFNRPKYHQDPAVNITGYPATVRQLIVTGLGHSKPTIIITNDHTSSPRQLITTYAHRMGIEQRIAEIIRAFNTDALSSTVNLNVDLDLALCVWAHATVAHLANRLPGYQGKTPDTIQRRFLQTPGTITTTPNHITINLDRRAYTPTLRQAHLPQNTPIPWLNNTPLTYHLN